MEGRIGSSEWAWQLSDHLDGVSWDTLTSGQDFAFVQVGVCIHSVG